ncbi:MULTISPECIES: PLP-dependent aminotransferase family protein [Rhodomicrobium]|uniref:aminotransferase-like domain-containing protein n=1 Tax=Rhodomicrobium TaxID=1068 RepID=UPI000B4A63D6|nr:MULTISPECIES: PLP-dependent aminotransferase family protein [Rhodomicrobium]
MPDWLPDLTGNDKPRYLAIADAIARDIKSGRLAPLDRLPPQRQLARRLRVDFTTVARGYVEAQKRGLIESRVGRGTFVRQAQRKVRTAAAARRPELVDFSMNLPPEPDDPLLLARMELGLEAVGQDLVALMRYQGFGGSDAAKDGALKWLAQRALTPAADRLFITPGAHPALLGIFTTLARSRDLILSEAITYPGARALAAQLGLELRGLPMDEAGIDPDAFAKVCAERTPKALYLNPTLQNPTTLTIPPERRAEIVAVARRYGVPIVEDDAYGFIPVDGPAPFTALAPELTWHVAGLAKCLGAGLRLAYVITPDARSGWPFAAALRGAVVMASPLTEALATRWIEDGTADALLRFIRKETMARQALAAEMLPAGSYRADPLSFHLWVPLSPPWTRSSFVGHMRASRIGVVASDAFTVDGTPIEAVRVCLGGPTERSGVRSALEFMAHALTESPAFTSSFL